MGKKDKKEKKNKKDKKGNANVTRRMSDGELTAAYIAAQLTRGQDALYSAEQRARLSELVEIAGETDIDQGTEMISAASDVALMNAAIATLNEDDLADAMEIASISGELAVLADVVAEMELTIISDFLFQRSERLRELSSANMMRFGSMRALVEGIEDSSGDLAEMGDDELAEGMARLELAEAAMANSEAMAAVGESMIADGLAALAATYDAGELEGVFELTLEFEEEE